MTKKQPSQKIGYYNEEHLKAFLCNNNLQCNDPQLVVNQIDIAAMQCFPKQVLFDDYDATQVKKTVTRLDKNLLEIINILFGYKTDELTKPIFITAKFLAHKDFNKFKIKNSEPYLNEIGKLFKYIKSNVSNVKKTTDKKEFFVHALALIFEENFKRKAKTTPDSLFQKFFDDICSKLSIGGNSTRIIASGLKEYKSGNTLFILDKNKNVIKNKSYKPKK
jgi:hypothetical protein